jgi:hypothetical protein
MGRSSRNIAGKPAGGAADDIVTPCAEDPPSWKQANREAMELSDQLESRIAWLTVSVVDASKPVVKIDGKPIPPAALGVPRATNPGVREISVSADGFHTRSMQVKLGEGTRRSILVALRRSAQRESAQREELPPVVAEPSDQEQADPILGYSLLGVGGVGILVGSVMGILTLDRKASLDSVCNDRTCPASAESDLDAYNALGTASGIAFGVGVASAAAGTSLLLTTRASEAPAVAGSVQLRADLGRLELRGSFQ